MVAVKLLLIGPVSVSGCVVPGAMRGHHTKSTLWHLIRYKLVISWLSQAIPANTASACVVLSKTSSSSRPIGWLNFSRRTVCVLSTITWEGLRRLCSAVGSTTIRSSGVLSRNSLVMGGIVTEGCWSNRSAWITRVGRGLP